MFSYYAERTSVFQENLVLSEREKELRRQKDSTGHIKKSNYKSLKENHAKTSRIRIRTAKV